MPEGQGWGTPAAPEARSSPGAAAAAGRRPGRLPFPAPSSRLLPAAQCARLLQPAGAAAHTLTLRAPPRLPAGWGLGQASATGRLRCSPTAAVLPPLQSDRDPNPEAEETPKSGEGSRVGRQTGVRAGGGLSWVWVRREQGQARSRHKETVALAGVLGRAVWAGGSAQGLQAASRRPRRPGPAGGQRQAGGQTCRGN